MAVKNGSIQSAHGKPSTSARMATLPSTSSTCSSSTRRRCSRARATCTRCSTSTGRCSTSHCLCTPCTRLRGAMLPFCACSRPGVGKGVGKGSARGSGSWKDQPSPKEATARPGVAFAAHPHRGCLNSSVHMVPGTKVLTSSHSTTWSWGEEVTSSRAGQRAASVRLDGVTGHICLVRDLVPFMGN